MCSSCHPGEDGHPIQSARRRWLNLLAAGLIIAAGAVSAALGLASLLDHHAKPAAAPARSAGVLGFRGRDLRSGRPLSAALRGRAVIVEFWSSACPDCRQAATRLQQFAAADRPPALVGIDVGDTPASARALVRRLGWRQLSAPDPEARYARTVGLRTLPTTLLLDRRHRIVLRLAGVRPLAALEHRFAQTAPPDTQHRGLEGRSAPARG